MMSASRRGGAAPSPSSFRTISLALSHLRPQVRLTAYGRGSTLKRKKDTHYHREDHNMLRYASTMVAAVTLGMVTVFAAPVHAQTTEKPLVLKGQSTHPASSNFHLRVQAVGGDRGEDVRRPREDRDAAGRARSCRRSRCSTPPRKDVLDVGMAPFGYILGRKSRRRFRCRTARCSAWTASTTTAGTTTAAA